MLLGKVKSDYFKNKKEGAHVGLCPYFWTEQVLKFR